MFLDAFGIPKEISRIQLQGYTYKLYGVMLLTAATPKPYIPPGWHGTIYSTKEVLSEYYNLYQPNTFDIKMHALKPYHPLNICCENCVVELSVLPDGTNVKGKPSVAFLLVNNVAVTNSIVTKEINKSRGLLHLEQDCVMRACLEGIDIIYIDDLKFFAKHDHKNRVYELLNKYKPGEVKGLWGKTFTNLRNTKTIMAREQFRVEMKKLFRNKC